VRVVQTPVVQTPVVQFGNAKNGGAISINHKKEHKTTIYRVQNMHTLLGVTLRTGYAVLLSWLVVV
jgi:hypothetical protein